MADLKISQFVDGGLVENTDEIAVVRAGVNTKVTAGSAARYEVGTGSGQIPSVDDLAPVALSGDYDDLFNLPTLGNLAAKDQVEASDINSGSATAGQVPTSDGSGGVTWEDQSGSGTTPASAVSALDPNNTGSTNVQGQLDIYGARIDGNYASYPEITSGDLTAQLASINSPVRVNGTLSDFTNAPAVRGTLLQGTITPISRNLGTLPPSMIWVFRSDAVTSWGDERVIRQSQSGFTSWKRQTIGTNGFVTVTIPASSTALGAQSSDGYWLFRYANNGTGGFGQLDATPYGGFNSIFSVSAPAMVTIIVPVNAGQNCDIIYINMDSGNSFLRFYPNSI